MFYNLFEHDFNIINSQYDDIHIQYIVYTYT